MKKNTFICLIILSTSLLVSSIQAAEGIQVHGHWMFNIYNVDGSFDRKLEFDNALTTTGSQSLLFLLNKEGYVNSWEIRLEGNAATGDDPCLDGLTANACIIREPGSSPTWTYAFNNLTFSLDSPSTPTKFILSGSIDTASGLTNPNIGRVETRILLCAKDDSSCKSTSTFTAKTITPVALQAGQTVQITVEISFS